MWTYLSYSNFFVDVTMWLNISWNIEVSCNTSSSKFGVYKVYWISVWYKIQEENI